jgi:succinoglycan biosynthesis transport protein ExoP
VDRGGRAPIYIERGDHLRHDGEQPASAPRTLQENLAVLRRRWWIFLLAAIVVPAAAASYSLQQAPVYRASADVVLNRQDLASALTGTPDLLAAQDPQRFVQTQASLARTPALAERVLRKVPSTDLNAESFLKSSSVSPASEADILTFSVRNRRPNTAIRLATEYAREFTAYRREFDNAALARARVELQRRITALRAQGARSSTYQNLLDRLRTLEALQAPNAILIRPAAQARQTEPRPVRNGLMGLALGLVLGVALVFLLEALDTRVRTSDEVAHQLGLPLLARLPQPPRALRRSRRLVTVEDPLTPGADAFRMLRTSIDFGSLNKQPRVIMITSATELEGKSTTVANLAVAYARAGKRVILVDLDLRRPVIHSFFDLSPEPGVTEVALGRVRLESALNHVEIPWWSGTAVRSVALMLSQPQSEQGPGGRVGHGRRESERLRPAGAVEVLTSGIIPPDPSDFAGTEALGRLLERLRREADVVLVDTPPLLSVDDAMVLSARVDGVVVVVKMSSGRRSTIRELRRLLDVSPAKKLGFVLTGTEPEAGYGYSYAYSPSSGEAPDVRREETG